MKAFFVCMSMALAVSLLAACGGGGGGSSAAVVQPPPPAQAVLVQIDAAVAPTVTSASLNAAAFGGELGSLGGAGVVGGPASPGLLSKLERLPVIGMSKVYTQTFNVTVGPITDDCLVSGSVTLTANVADPLTITAGDLVSALYNMCDDGDGVVLDGLMDMEFKYFAGSLDTGLFSAQIAVHIEYGVSMDDGGAAGPLWVGGDYLISMDSMEYPVLSTSVSSDFSVWLYRESDGKALGMKNFITGSGFDASTFTSTINAMGTLSSNQFDGEAHYETVEPFVMTGASHPYTGQMLITGADSATIRVTALDELTVRLEMDYDGDGAVDETVDLSWDEAIMYW
jgi:hypothetical protein